MDLEIDREHRDVAPAPPRVPERTEPARGVREAPPREPPSREPQLLPLRGSVYRVSDDQVRTMLDIGTFRTVALEDLARYRYDGAMRTLRRDLRELSAQGLVQSRTVWTGPRHQALHLAVLTKTGKELLERHRTDREHVIYARLVKTREARHDAAIYRMYQVEKAKLERAEGRIRRVVLDYELKRNLYAPLAKAKQKGEAEYAKCQAQLAQQFGLKVIHGRVLLPDLRLEYEAASGEMDRVDLELATGHYHGSSMAAKAAAGFKFYAADGSAAKLSRVLEERDITVAILSL